MSDGAIDLTASLRVGRRASGSRRVELNSISPDSFHVMQRKRKGAGASVVHNTNPGFRNTPPLRLINTPAYLRSFSFFVMAW